MADDTALITIGALARLTGLPGLRTSADRAAE
jgi:hypothetical protein